MRRLEDVEAMLEPMIHKHGFSTSLSSQPGAPADHTRFVLMVRHVGGHAEEHTWDAPIDDKGIKGKAEQDAAAWRRVIHVLRRALPQDQRVRRFQTYRDDDGNAAGTGEGAEPITQEQFQTLNDEADKSGADKVRLAAWYKSAFGVDALAKLPARHFDRVKLMLENRARKGGGDG